MSALMAERRDWAEDPRQASLFDALAPPPERAQPGQDPDPPREQARVVEFPKRPGMPGAPADPVVEDGPAGGLEDARTVGGVHVGPEAAAVADSAPEAAFVADSAPAVEGASAIEPEIVVAPEDLVGDETCTPRVAGSPLTGPTLDDVMSRVWEGLVTGLPAACPVCHGEVLPFAGGPPGGRCTSCATTID